MTVHKRNVILAFSYISKSIYKQLLIYPAKKFLPAHYKYYQLFKCQIIPKYKIQIKTIIPLYDANA